MPRRTRAAKRIVSPDARYHSVTLSRLINQVMLNGKKSKSEGVVYNALQIIERQDSKSPIDVFEQAIRNVTPQIEAKPRRVGGATYQVPVEVWPERGLSLAIRWLIGYARERGEKTMKERLAGELMDAANNEGASIKKKQDTFRMAEANKAFAHYRW